MHPLCPAAAGSTTATSLTGLPTEHYVLIAQDLHGLPAASVYGGAHASVKRGGHCSRCAFQQSGAWLMGVSPHMLGGCLQGQHEYARDATIDAACTAPPQSTSLKVQATHSLQINMTLPVLPLINLASMVWTLWRSHQHACSQLGIPGFLALASCLCGSRASEREPLVEHVLLLASLCQAER